MKSAMLPVWVTRARVVALIGIDTVWITWIVFLPDDPGRIMVIHDGRKAYSS